MSLLWGWGKACSIDAFGATVCLGTLVTKSARRAKAAEEREATEEWVLRPRLPKWTSKVNRFYDCLSVMKAPFSGSILLSFISRNECKDESRKKRIPGAPDPAFLVSGSRVEWEAGRAHSSSKGFNLKGRGLRTPWPLGLGLDQAKKKARVIQLIWSWFIFQCPKIRW